MSSKEKPGKKLVGYLVASTRNPYMPTNNPYAQNCYSYTHFKKMFTEECETKDIPNWRKIKLEEDNKDE